MNNLFIQTAFLGDLLLSIPSLKQIRYWDSKSQLTLVCRKGYGSLMKELGLCDEIIEVDRVEKKTLAKQLSDRKFNVVFCPHQSYSSHQLVKGLKANQKVGYKKWWNFNIFSKRVKRHLDWPEAMRQLQLVGAVSDSIATQLDAFSVKVESIPPWAQMNLSSLNFSDSEAMDLIQRKANGFKLKEKFICIAPGSVWPTKRWTPEKYVRLSTQFARKGYQILILGSPEEREFCEKMKLQIPNSYCLAGLLSIRESLMILSYAEGLVCNDSGAMHMASVVGAPTLAIFGPTVQELGYKPWNPKAAVYENKKLLCRPCGQHGARSCPIGTHQCMKRLDESKVFKQALATFC